MTVCECPYCDHVDTEWEGRVDPESWDTMYECAACGKWSHELLVHEEEDMYSSLVSAAKHADIETSIGWSRPNKGGVFTVTARLCPSDVVDAINSSDDAMAELEAEGFPNIYVDTEFDERWARYDKTNEWYVLE